MKKLDVALLLGLLVLLGAQGLLFRSTRGSSWQEREKAVEEQVHKTFSGDYQELYRSIQNRPELRWRFELASFGATIALAGALAGLIRLLLCLLTGRPFYRPLAAPPPSAWGLAQILRLTGAILLVINAAVLLEWGLFQLFRPVWLDRPLTAVINTLLADGVALAAAFLFFRRAGRPAPARRRWTGVGFALAAYLTFLPFLFALMAAVTLLLQAIHVSPAPQPVFTLFLSETRSSVLGWLLVLVAVIGPMAEEAFFRGLIYGWLRVRWGVFRALFLSALLFALLHTDAVVFVPIFALGLLFGWVYEQTGTLAAPAAIHILHNGAMMYAAFLLKTLMEMAPR